MSSKKPKKISRPRSLTSSASTTISSSRSGSRSGGGGGSGRRSRSGSRSGSRTRITKAQRLEKLETMIRNMEIEAGIKRKPRNSSSLSSVGKKSSDTLRRNALNYLVNYYSVNRIQNNIASHFQDKTKLEYDLSKRIDLGIGKNGARIFGYKSLVFDKPEGKTGLYMFIFPFFWENYRGHGRVIVAKTPYIDPNNKEMQKIPGKLYKKSKGLRHWIKKAIMKKVSRIANKSGKQINK